MKLFIDDANLDEIRRIYDQFPVDGVTTNPSILYHAGKDPRLTLREIRDFIGPGELLFAQAIPETAEGMVKDAHFLVELLGPNTVVKIPSVPEGFKAIRILRAEGVLTCGTVVYTAMQAYLAAKAGASFVAPYVNRIDNMGYDGIAVTREIQDILTGSGMDCQVLAASFKNSQQMLALAAYGVGSATAAPVILDGLVKNLAIDGAIDDFTRDFRKLTGKNAMCEL